MRIAKICSKEVLLNEINGVINYDKFSCIYIFIKKW